MLFRSYQYDSKQVVLFKEVISSIRNLKAESNLASSKKAKIFINAKNDNILSQIENNKQLILSLSGCSELTIQKNLEKPNNSSIGILKECEIYLSLDEIINKDDEIKKLSKRLLQVEGFIDNINQKLSNSSFMEKAPENIVQNEKNKLSDLSIERKKIISNIEVLK